MSPYFGLTLLFDCWTFVLSSSDDDRARVGVGGVDWVSRAGHVTPPPLLWVESRNWSSNIQLSSGEYSRAFLDICLYKIPVQWWWPLSSALASTFPSVLTPNSSAEDLKIEFVFKIFPAETWYKIIRGFRVQQVSILTSCCCCQVTWNLKSYFWFSESINQIIWRDV